MKDAVSKDVAKQIKFYKDEQAAIRDEIKKVNDKLARLQSEELIWKRLINGKCSVI